VEQPGSPGRRRAAPATEDAAPHRRASLFLQGVVSASVLGAYTIAGAVGAFLALLPVALRAEPRGRGESTPSRVPAPEGSREPAAG
jgi:hypothetical protein